MIGEILNAIFNECLAYVKDNPTSEGQEGVVIFKTDFKSDGLTTHAMPLVIIDIPDGPETGQYLGGATRMDLVIALNCYNYQPDAYNNDQSGYSATLTNFIDGIRQHFSFGKWLTTGMSDIESNFGFRITLSGIVPADALDQDGLIKGFRVVFDSMAVDDATDLIAPSDVTLETVEQEDFEETIILTVNDKRLQPLSYLNLQGNLLIQVPANTYIDSIFATALSSNPNFQIGTTDGDDDFVPNTTPGSFKKLTIEEYFPEAVTLYLTLAGGTMEFSILCVNNFY